MNKQGAPAQKTAFSAPGALPGSLSMDAVASLVAAVGDLTFILTRDGTILDVAVSQGELANHGFADLIGESWIETMTVESRPKAVEMLASAVHAAPRIIRV